MRQNQRDHTGTHDHRKPIWGKLANHIFASIAFDQMNFHLNLSHRR
jgi:hypothetical protein